MEKIDLLDDFLHATSSDAIEIPEQQIQELAEKVKEMNAQYAIKANGSLISAANVFLNK